MDETLLLQKGQAFPASPPVLVPGRPSTSLRPTLDFLLYHWLDAESLNQRAALRRPFARDL